MDVGNINRPLSSETSSQQLFQDDYDEILRLARESGRQPAELIRDIVSEGLSARRGQIAVLSGILQSLRQLIDQNRLLIDQNRLANEANERLQLRAELAEERWESLKRALIHNLREFYGIQLENLGASIAAKNLVWNYVARVIMDQSGLTGEEIELRYDDEKKRAIEERESIALAIEQVAKNLVSPNAPVFEGNQPADFVMDLRPTSSSSDDDEVGDRNGFSPQTSSKS